MQINTKTQLVSKSNQLTAHFLPLPHLINNMSWVFYGRSLIDVAFTVSPFTYVRRGAVAPYTVNLNPQPHFIVVRRAVGFCHQVNGYRAFKHKDCNSSFTRCTISKNMFSLLRTFNIVNPVVDITPHGCR